MHLKFKEGVRLHILSPYIQEIMWAACKVWALLGKEPTVTSCNDGKHMKDSLHYKDKALDLRIIDVQKDLWPKLVEGLKTMLESKGYQVILETDHIHVEFDK